MKNKKLLIILIVLIVFISAALLAFIFNRKKPLESPENYTIDEDTVSSITTIVGDRSLKSMKEESFGGDESQKKDDDEEKDDKKDKKGKDKKDKEEEKDAKDTKDSKEEKSEEEQQQTSGETKRVEYVYTEIETPEEDVNTYMEFLINDCNYISMPPIDESETTIAAATESLEEGKIFQISVDYTEDGYTVLVQKYPGQILKPEEEEPEEEEQNTGLSWDGAMSKLEEYTPEQLGVPDPVSEYILIPNRGRYLLEGAEFFNINAYKKENGSNIIMGVFYVACDGSMVYKYDVENDTYTKIS